MCYNYDMKIALLEDDVALNKALSRALAIDGHDVVSFYDGSKLLEAIDPSFELYILDLNVGGVDGFGVLEHLKNMHTPFESIVISADSHIDSIKTAYALGSLDYLKKPFHLDELRIKIERLAQRNEQRFEQLPLTSEDLTKKEHQLLELLLEHKNGIVTYEQIEAHLYPDKPMTHDALRALVKRLRSKLRSDIIKTINQVGYKLEFGK